MIKTTQWVTFSVVWVAVALGGFLSLRDYATTPGAKAQTPQMWPLVSKLNHEKRSTLVVFLHPDCACSRATVGELDILLARVQTRLQTHVVFVRPEGWSDARLHGTLWASAQAIHGVDLSIDDDSSQAKLFGARTSGHTFLYDAEGRLLFSGGITESRGHLGENDGVTSVVALVNGMSGPVVPQTPVFGCGLKTSGKFAGVNKIEL